MPRLGSVFMLSLAILAGCAGKAPAGPCATNDACEAGEICLDRACAALCVSDLDCSTSDACLDGVCAICDDCRLPPELISVDATGTPDGAAGRGSSHLAGSLVLEGANFAGASVLLDGGPFESAVLPPCDAIAEGVEAPDRLEVALPPELVAGTFSLTVSNQAGSCETTLTLLQGETGEPGPPGTYAIGNGLSLAGDDLSVNEAAIDAMVANNGFASDSDVAGLTAQLDAVQLQIDALAAAPAPGVPVGTIVTWGGATPPSGWLICDGQTLERADHADLFTLIGTSFGSTTGSNFLLPDLRGRAPIGLDTAGRIPGGWAAVVGGAGGEGQHTLTIAEMPSHTHEWNRALDGINNNCTSPLGSTCESVGSGGATGGGGPHNIVQPSLAVQFIIKI